MILRGLILSAVAVSLILVVVRLINGESAQDPLVLAILFLILERTVEMTET